MYDDIRVMNTPSLIALAEDSSAQGYNRTIEVEWIKKMADPAGYHVGAILLYHHQSNRPLKPHHRVEILMKTRLSDLPDKFTMDITIDRWSWLYTPDEWQAMVDESQKPQPDFLSVGKKFGRVKHTA